MKIDADVLEWFKSQGKGYKTKINSVLRSYAFG
nr:BrnA antitoxin family protein [Treponema denticola]